MLRKNSFQPLGTPLSTAKKKKDHSVFSFSPTRLSEKSSSIGKRLTDMPTWLLLATILALFIYFYIELLYVPGEISVKPMYGKEISDAYEFMMYHTKLNNVTLRDIVTEYGLRRDRRNLDNTGLYVVNKDWHWVVVDIVSPSQIYYFDPFGRKPPEGSIGNFYSEFETRSYNVEKLQHDQTVVCGAYCVYYMYQRYLDKRPADIVPLFKDEFQNFGYSPSIKRDHLLYQQVFTFFKIRIWPLQRAVLQFLRAVVENYLSPHPEKIFSNPECPS